MTKMLATETYLPEAADVDVLAHIDALLQSRPSSEEATDRPYLLFGPGTDERIEIPAEVYRVLRHVIVAMHHGMAVTVIPAAMTLTTQQAAELLGVSRPTLIRYLDAGDIPYDRPGTHRRVRLQDVLAFREHRREAQYAALEDTSVDLGDEEDLPQTLERLKAVRHRRASERRAQQRLSNPAD